MYTITYREHNLKFADKRTAVDFLLNELWGEIMDFTNAEFKSDEEEEHLRKAEEINNTILEIVDAPF